MKRMKLIVALMGLALVLSAIVPAGAQGGVTVVANANLTLRAGPSSSAESFGTVPFQTELEATAISSDRGWVAVAYNGQPGWLSLQYTGVVGGDLAALPVSDQVFPRGGAAPVTSGVTIAPTVNLRYRAEPNLDARPAGAIPVNTEVPALALSDDGVFVLVSYLGQNVWVAREYVREVSGSLDSLTPGQPPATTAQSGAPQASVPVPSTATEFHGVINRNTTWSGEIHVTGDVEVRQGVTLTIAPGTVIRIAALQDAENLVTHIPSYLLEGINTGSVGLEGVEPGEPFRDERHHISFNIIGTLHAVGTPEQPIIFTSDSPTPQPFDWNYLWIRNGTLSYAGVEYHRGVQAFDGVTISHSTVRYAGEIGIGTGPGASPIIEDNNISYAGHELLYLDGGAPVIRNNTLGPNPFEFGAGSNGGVGIAIRSGAAQITGNSIFGCAEGILFLSPQDPTLILEGNSFQGNGSDIEHRY